MTLLEPEQFDSHGGGTPYPGTAVRKHVALW